MSGETKAKAKKRMEKKEKRANEITTPPAQQITPKLGTFRAERHILCNTKNASELERLARVLRTYEWVDHRAKVARKEDQITERDQVDQVRRQKGGATREAGVAEANRVDVPTQRDSEPMTGGRFTQLEEEAKEVEKVVIKLRAQAVIREGAIENEEAAQEASNHELSEVRISFASRRFFFFHIG